MILNAESEVELAGENANKNPDKDQDKHEDEMIDTHEVEDDDRDDDNRNSGADGDTDEEDDNDWNSLTLEGLREKATQAFLKNKSNIETTESQLKNVITTLRTDITNLQQTNSTLTTEKEQATAETDFLTREARETITNLQQTNSTLTTEKEQAIAEAKETKVTLQRANDEMDRERETIRMKDRMLSDLKVEKVSHQKHLDDITTQLEAAMVENQRIVPLTNQLQMRINMEMEEGQIVADLKKEKVVHQQQLETVRTQLEATATENQHLLCLTDQLRTKINMLMEDIPIISELEAEKAVHQQQLEDVRLELEATTTENQRLLGLTNQLQTRINTLMADIPELEAEKVVHQQQLDDVRTQLEAATTENQRIVPLTNQLQTRINMLVQKGQIVADLEVEKVIQQTQLENVQTQLEATTTENQRLLPLTNELQTRIDMLTEVGVDQQTQLGEVRTQLETATTENDRLLPLTNQLQARIDLLMGEFPIISELKAEKVVQQQQLEDVTAQLVAALAENERIVPLTDQLQTRIEMLTEVVRNNLMDKQKE